MRYFGLSIAAIGTILALGGGTAIAAGGKITITPNPIDCGGGAPMMATKPVTVTIANTDPNLSILVQRPTIGGTNPQNFVPDFGIYNMAFPLQLNGNTSIDITITFTPTAIQNYSATLIVNSDAANGNQTIPMTGKGGYPMIMYDTKTLIFGNQRVGVPSAPGIFTISNPGAGDLTVSMITLGGANPGDFSFTPNPPITLKPGASAKLSVTFKPMALGGRSASITVVSNGNMGMQQTDVLQVIGSGTQANVVCGPMSLDFGSQNIFTASTPKAATASNNAVQMADSYYVIGGNMMGATGISGAQKDWFTISPPLPQTTKVAPNMSININVVAVPLALGPGTASLDIVTDNNMNCSIPLKVLGVGSHIDISPGYADFGASPILVDSAPQEITVTNKGTSDLNITDFEILGDQNAVVVFNVPDPPKPTPTIMAPLKLAPQGSFKFNVVFHPAVVMPYNGAWVELHTDDPMAKLVRVPLSGLGTMAGFSINKTGLNFGQIPVNTVSPPQNFTISNTGGSDIVVTKIMNGNPGAFMIDQTGPFTIPAGKSQQVNVTFSPLTGGTINDAATIMVMSLKTAMVSLTGTAIAPTLGIAPTALDFGMVQSGRLGEPQTVGLKAGAVAISLDKITSSDASFVIDMANTKNDLAPGAQTTFDVNFKPTEVAKKSSTISVYIKGQTNPIQMIMATGEGTPGRTNKPAGGCSTGGRGSNAWPLGLLVLAGLFGGALLRRTPLQSRSRRAR
jgi:hypothetical protein